MNNQSTTERACLRVVPRRGENTRGICRRRGTGMERRIAAVTLLALSSEAMGFAEDICPQVGGGWAQCSLQLCPQQMAESGNLVCETIAMATLIVVNREEMLAGPGRRSTLHMDATYYMAQAVGMTPRQAFRIASYDQAIDLPQPEWRDESGSLLVSGDDCEVESPPEICELRPLPLTALDRNNFGGGGVNFHFMAPQSSYGAPPLAVDGFKPDLSDPFGEPFLAHLRRWAFGESDLLCVGGYTSRGPRGDYATGDRCYQDTREPAQYLGEIPFVSELGVLGSVAWTADLGEQLLRIDPPLPANAVEDYLGADVAPFAKLGVYLHALADRVSHQLCTTHSRQEGPRPTDAPDIVTSPLGYPGFLLLTQATNPTYLLSQLLTAPVVTNPDFHLQFDSVECDQPSHAARHNFERGHDQSTLLPEHRTLQPGLDLTYGELLSFARAHGVARQGADVTAYRDEVVDGLVAAISKPAPAERLVALNRFAEARGFAPLPGYDGLDYAAWSARAGVLKLPSSSRNDEAAFGGAFSVGWPLAALALLHALRLARRLAWLGRRAAHVFFRIKHGDLL